jgi:branched-subunit amino acid transport protein
MNSLLFIVVMMSVVTYVPRMLPMVFLKDIRLRRYIQTFLGYIPYAALASLIFPGFINSTGEKPSAIIGISVATILSYFKVNLIVVLGLSVLSVVGFKLVFA